MAQTVISNKFLKDYILSTKISREKYFELIIKELNMISKGSGIQFDENGNPLLEEDQNDIITYIN